MKISKFHITNSQMRPRECGHVMLILLLTMALMAIFVGIIVPSITFEIKRDREEEMIHRGVQYSRAIRLYYKKFGRYPAKIEDLENTSQMRFLRKRYKDPLTGKDFKLLHYGEAKMTMNALGGMIPGANPMGTPMGANGLSGGGLSQTSAFGGNSSFGTSNSAFGQNAQSNSITASPDPAAAGDATQTGDAAQTAGGATATNPGGNSINPPGSASTLGGSSDKLGNTQFGGAPVVGVASLDKDKTIREFDKKKKYNEWQFVYDPTMDRGFLITTPYQQQLQAFGMQGTSNLNGQNGSNPNGSSPNGSNSSFGNSFGGSSFGNSNSSFGNSPSQPSNGGFGNPSPPSQPPQSPQQQ